MAWITPKTDWVETDFYNYTDLNRVENNTDFLLGHIANIVIPPVLASRITTRTNSDLDYFESINRIENNIKLLGDASVNPNGWITPYTSWISVYKGFSYIDANRLESNLLNLKTMIDLIIESFRYCGTFSAGDDFTF